MIQDNLIKFSTFLQQQETRKFKDSEATKVEKAKIILLDEEIKVQQIKLSICENKALDIDRSVDSMRRYEQFLEKVKEANPDEFEDLISILSRYKTLLSRNKDLKNMQLETIAKNEEISTNLVKLEAELQSRTMEMSNMKAKRTEDQFMVDQEKSHLQQMRDEVAKEKSK